jgi:hypothetical protein
MRGDPPHGRSILALQVGCILLLLAGVAIDVYGLQPHNRLPCRPEQPGLPLKSIGGGPVLQLELVWRDDDIATILDPTNEPAIRKGDLSDARRGNEIDSWLFIPTYSGLLLALAALAAVSSAWPGRRLFLAVGLGIGLAAAADWSENHAITQALDHLTTGASHVGDAVRISTPALVKWSLIGLVLTVIGAWFIKAARWWTVVVGALLVGVAVFDAYGLISYACERSRSVSKESSPATFSVQGEEAAN